MSEILDAVRDKWPAYKQWSDDELALAVGEKWPVYLDQDKSFKQEYLNAGYKRLPISQADRAMSDVSVGLDAVIPGLSAQVAPPISVGLPPPTQPFIGAPDETVGQIAAKPMHALGTAVADVANTTADIYNQSLPVTSGILPPITARMQPGQPLVAPETIKTIEGYTPGGYALQKLEEASPQVAGLRTAARNAISGFTTPENLALLPFAAAKPVQLAFAGMMAMSTPDVVKATQEVLRDPQATTAQKWEAMGDAGIQLAMIGALSLHMTMAEIKAKYSPEDVARVTAEPAKPAEPAPLTTPEQIAPVAPLTAEALKQTPQPKEPNAIQEQKPDAEVLRPTEQGTGGVVELQGVGTQDIKPVETPTEIPAQPSAGTSETGKVEAPLNPGGALKDLPPDLQAKSNAVKEQMKAEVEKVKAQQAGEPDKTIPPGPGAATNPNVAGEGAELPLDPGNPDIYGIAARVREQRAKAGVVEPVPPGEGIAAPDSVQHGRELLKAGADPEQVLADFEKTKRLSSDDMAVVRARGEQLQQEARAIEQKSGTDSDEYRAAKAKLSEFDKRSKTMQTEWGKTGMAQQGETDIDTGSFTGLEREYRNTTGKDFTTSQAGKAKVIAGGVTAADVAANTAEKELFTELDKTSTAKIAQAEKRTDAEKRAYDAAMKATRDWAATRAEKDAKSLELEAARKAAADKLANAEALKAKTAAEKVTRDSAIRQAKAESKELERRADVAKKQAEEARKAEAKAKAAVDKFNRDAAARKAKAEQDRMENPESAVWKKVKEYIDEGKDGFDDIRNKVATDLGMKVDEVTRLMGKNAKVKYLADNVWRKQFAARRIKQQAKVWLNKLSTPILEKVLAAPFNAGFRIKTTGHGWVALATHAPMVAGLPQYWTTYIRDFGKMYRMVGSLTPKGQRAGVAFYERQMQDLTRRPNYTEAQRAGLQNDPFKQEEYESPATKSWVGKLAGMGDRGYSILKILRQDMFDQQWNKLPASMKTAEVAKAIADDTNHITGVTKASAPRGLNLALFAPRLLGSRVAFAAIDPARMVGTFVNWKNATPAEKYFAINQIKSKATIVATVAGALALNQAFLSAIGSDQKVNMTDPMKGDYLKFKVAGMQLSYGNAMLTMARLPVRMYAIWSSNGGKTKALIYPDEEYYSVLGEYARTQLSPTAGLGTTLAMRQDWQRRQLPNSNRPQPARLRRQGVAPYTWPEFWSEQVLPIPAEEAAREVWKGHFDMDDHGVESMRKALATISVMTATGARLTEDYEAGK